MALSFEDEIRGFLYHSVEQDQFFQEALAAPEGGHTVDAKEAIYALARAHAIHSKALLRIARAIDELRAELI
jgi:hypothetical protein